VQLSDLVKLHWLVGLATCATGCATDPSADGSTGDDKADRGGPSSMTTMTSTQKHVAEELTSIWENDTPKLDYAYAENIGDGRGYTSGRAGFCTGTGDAIQVVACYDGKVPGNAMAKYMPALTVINDRYEQTGDDQASTAELDAVGNWAMDWAASADDAQFRACQDAIVSKLYFNPAMAAAQKWGLKTALTKAALYDMWINQGDDALVLQTNAALGGRFTEDQWLKQFLIARRDLMWGDDTWKQAVDRVAGYEKQRRLGNWDLSKTIRNDVRASDCWGGPYTSSGYTIREISPDGTWTTPTATSYACQ
jgi:chitosanase